MTITEFLLARIAWDEIVWRELAKHDAAYGLPGLGDRLLRESHAQRLLVEAAQRRSYLSEHILLTLAAVYSQHPDYDPAWAS